MHWSGVAIIALLLPYGVLAIALREPLVDTDVIIDGTATLLATVTDNPNKFPISWRRQDTQEVLTLGEFVFSTQLYIRDRYDIQVSGETYILVISNVELRDEGIFEIGFIRNTQFVLLSSTTMSVLIPPNLGFPVCNVSPGGTEYLVGQSLTLSCESKGGKPVPDIVWFRNSIELKRTSLSNILNHEVTLETSDAGVVFECRLAGPAVKETLSCQTRLTVATPTVSLSPSVVQVDEGSDAVFNCVGEGVLSPAYVWSIPTDIPSSRYAIENSNRRFTLLKTTIADNNAVIRCEITSSGKIVAGRSATLVIRPGPTTKQPTVAATTMGTTTASTTIRPTTIPATTKFHTPHVTTQLQQTSPVKITTADSASTISITMNQILDKTTKYTVIKRQTTLRKIETAPPKTSEIPVSSELHTTSQNVVTRYITEPQDIFITTPLIDSTGKIEPTSFTTEKMQKAVPKQESDRRNSQHLGIIFAAATAMILVLTIVVFAAFCLVICKPRAKKNSFNVSNNASSLAGSATTPPYDSGVFRRQSSYYTDCELRDSVSQRESQASATESAAAVTNITSPEDFYTMPAKLGKPSVKLYHKASSSHPDFSTFRLVDDSLYHNLSANSLGKRPRPVPAPKPPKSYAKYENVYRNNTGQEVLEAEEVTPLQSYSVPLQSSAIYENGRDLQNSALLGNDAPASTSPAPKKPSPVPSPRNTSAEYTYEDVMKIADTLLHDLEQIS
ncbi:flocculation protein FLO11-like [Anneissia japonica]|uniref:flocculation protein FLO11-like n=1 Tax=Anneissia japonica TaxID=1529436 RepID=UPI0014255452|nr:flocculation protein FLO11-like [Anneissia japonica]